MITYKAVVRWQCSDGTKSWYAGPDYRFGGKLASEVILGPREPPYSERARLGLPV